LFLPPKKQRGLSIGLGKGDFRITTWFNLAAIEIKIDLIIEGEIKSLRTHR
jgi:hypothetical protein